ARGSANKTGPLLWPECFLPEQLAWGVSETSKISSISTNAAGFCVKKPWNIQRIPAALCLTSCLCLRNIRHFLCFQIHHKERMAVDETFD
ncbi:MAG: hypothetical protein WAX54_09680, partial [Gemmiger qucibialis]